MKFVSQMLHRKFDFYHEKSSITNDNVKTEKDTHDILEFNPSFMMKYKNARNSSPQGLSGIHSSKNDLRQAMHEANELLRQANDELARILRSSLDK